MCIYIYIYYRVPAGQGRDGVPRDPARQVPRDKRKKNMKILITVRKIL